MIFSFRYLICDAAAPAAKDIIVVYGALRGVGDSQEQIKIAVLDHMMGIIRLSEQTAWTASIFLVEVDAFKNFEQA